MNTAHHLAQLNIATMKEPADSPVMAEFMANIERINALADAAPGFVWRLTEDPPVNPFGPMTLVNLSMWRDVAALSDFVHRSAHVEIMRRRREWFTRLAEASMVLWWVPTGHIPTVDEAHGRLMLLRRQGPSTAAFTFASSFDPPVAAPRFDSVTPRVPVPDIEAALTFYVDRLGFELAWKWGEPLTHAGICRGDASLDLIVVPPARQGTAMAYIRLAGVDAYHAELRARNVTTSEIGDRPYGLRDFEVLDPIGNRFVFGEPLEP